MRKPAKRLNHQPQICPYCHSRVLKHFARHKEGCHPTTAIRVTPGNPPIKNQPREGLQKASRLEQCLACKALLPSSYMAIHLKSCSVKSELESLRRSAKRLPFLLLPPGDSLTDAIETYKKLMPLDRRCALEELEDINRLKRIDSLGPVTRRYVGKKAWSGCWVFEFQNSDKVVLECPRTDNATYVLSGEWKEMVRQTKAELRSSFRHLTQWILHTPGWESRVRSAVFGSRPGR